MPSAWTLLGPENNFGMTADWGTFVWVKICGVWERWMDGSVLINAQATSSLKSSNWTACLKSRYKTLICISLTDNHYSAKINEKEAEAKVCGSGPYCHGSRDYILAAEDQ
jgi:hypothetical protein